MRLIQVALSWLGLGSFMSCHDLGILDATAIDGWKLSSCRHHMIYVQRTPRALVIPWPIRISGT